MKGMVFTEFVEMVEESFSPEIADRMITEANVPNGGAYTSVGLYDHTEMLSLVTVLSQLTNTSVPELVRTFGGYLLGRFVAGHGHFFEGMNCTFDFLESVNSTVHTEVLKLYPDAQLPHFATDRSGDTLIMIYRSKRPFADLAEGLILGSFDHFNETVTLQREDSRDEDDYVSRFVLQVH
jgi:hypothetical protein